MSEVLSIEEMKSRYAGEWVLIAEPEVDEHLRVQRGRVVAHDADRDLVDRQALTLRLSRSASLCFKQPPPGMAYIL